MGETLDRLAQALASGAPRRAAVAGILAAATATLPWSAEARHHHKHKKNDFSQFQMFCQEWCEAEFFLDPQQAAQCTRQATSGKGPCYSSTEQGPGYFCTHVKHCGKQKRCCPGIGNGGPVTDGACCARNTNCNPINGTAGFFCLQT